MVLLGLGNPGDEYAETRHNAGFVLADAARRRWGNRPWAARGQSEESRIRLSGAEHRVVRPTAFMNRSGLVAADLKGAGIAPGDLLVLLDDIDLPLGRLRIRTAGGAGGHRGLQSILDALQTTEVARLRIGVGRPEGEVGVVGHVLGAFSAEERERFAAMIERGLDALALALIRGVEAAMNRYNGLPAPWEEASSAPSGRARSGGLDKRGPDGAK